MVKARRRTTNLRRNSVEKRIPYWLIAQQAALIEKLYDRGVVITGSHFVCTKKAGVWYHSSFYVSKELATMSPKLASELGRWLARAYVGTRVDTVVGPAHGAIVLAHEVAEHLTAMQEAHLLPDEGIMSCYAEHAGNGMHAMTIRGIFAEAIAGKEVLVVEDVLTTGLSAAQVIGAVRALGGNVVGLAALCNRGNVQPSDVGNVPITALLGLAFEKDLYPEDGCPLCAQGVPVRTDLGHGAEFLSRRSGDTPS